MKTLCILFLCFGVFALYACGRESEYIIRLEKIAVNETDKDLMMTVFTEVGNDSVNLSNGDSLSMKFEQRGTAKLYWYAYLHIYPICITQEVLYNLTDTAQYTYPIKYNSDFYDGFPYSNEKEKIYSERLAFADTGSYTYIKVVATLKIDEALLDSIMEKDYTMLDRFKDYYKR